MIMHIHLQVLFYSLPLVLDSCKQQRAVGEGESVAMVARSEEEKEGGAEDEIVEQAVEFLQALLDLMTDLHLHLEVGMSVRMYDIILSRVYKSMEFDMYVCVHVCRWCLASMPTCSSS